MTWWLWVLLVLATFLFHATLACPKDICICKWKGGKQTVECGNRHLNTFPDGLDPGTQVLNFSGNSLTVLKSEWFHKMDLINLQKIFLARNQIVRVHNRAFKGLTNLVELDLSENMLTAVPTESFQDYSSLMRLSLNGNPIRELRAAAFKHLSFLTTLELSDCQIETVANEVFVGMDNLEWLRLDGNRITTIRGHHILPDSLHGISLHGNRWACDCKLIDLHNWLTTSTVPHLEEPKCAQPTRLAGSSIKSVASGDLACFPEISPGSLFVEVAEGRNLTVSCRVNGIPPPTITWWFQGQLLQNDSFGNPGAFVFFASGTTSSDETAMAAMTGGISSSSSSDSNSYADVTEKRTELFIANTTIETNGTYLCVAENAAGRSQANYTIRVIIKEEPVVEQVKFPYEYFLIIIAGAVCMAIIVLLIVCVLVYKCCCRSGSADPVNVKSTSAASVAGGGKKCHRNSSTSLTIGMTHTNAGGNNNNSNSILHHNHHNHLGTHHGLSSSMHGSGNGKSGANKLASIMNDMDPEHGGGITSPKSFGQQQDNNSGLLLYGNDEDLIKDGGNPNVNPATAQYMSPPSSVRNYSPDPINPDLINDAEKNKGRNSHSQDQQQDEMSYERPSGPSSLQNEHISKQMMIPTSQHSGKTTLVSTLPRNGILANNKLAHDLYHHQVDVHLNPSCFLTQSNPNAPPGYHPVEYNMTKVLTMVPRINNGPSMDYAYRTLPHPARLKIRPTLSANRYSRDAEFSASLTHQPQVYDIYTPVDIRYTAEGYPYTTAPITIGGASVTSAPLMNSTTTQTNLQHHQLVAFCPSSSQHLLNNSNNHPDGGTVLAHQYLPSPPEGYKSEPVVISSGMMSPVVITQQQNQGQQQWPSCLPGYHHHSQIVPIKTHSQGVSLQHQQQQRYQSPLQSPASSITSSSSSMLSSAQGIPTSNNNLNNQQQQLSIGKRCVAAQTVNTGCLVAGDGKEKKESIIMEQREDEETEELAERNRLAANGDKMIKDCCGKGEVVDDEDSGEDGEHGGGVGERKLRHLNGPLADSPDEGYVGDSQEGSVD